MIATNYMKAENNLDSATLSEAAILRMNAKNLHTVAMGMLTVAIITNVVGGTYYMVPCLAITLGILSCNLLIMRFTQNALVALYCASLVLLAMGTYILLVTSLPDASILLWYLLFPPMLMLCLGLKHGTLMCAVTLISVLTLLFTPVSHLLVVDFSMQMRVRFVLVMISTFVLSFLAESARAKTHKALRSAISTLEQYAKKDPLTELDNRRGFQAYFTEHQNRKNSETIQEFAVALGDVDFFKSVNDAYGHHIGDLVLRHMAQVMSMHIRSSDRVFRWGGEEFLVFMPHTRTAEGRSVAQRLCDAVAETPFVHEDVIIPLSISIGVYSGPLAEGFDVHIKKADEQLYLAKNNGRNRVHAAGVE